MTLGHFTVCLCAMEDGRSTRLERLQAAQDRLLRYAHFRLGEELTKARLGVDGIPAHPSAPGVWDLAFTPDNADALGLIPNSFDSFAQPSPPGALGSASGPGPRRGVQRQRGESTNHSRTTRTTLLRVTSEGSGVTFSSGGGSDNMKSLQHQSDLTSSSSILMDSKPSMNLPGTAGVDSGGSAPAVSRTTASKSAVELRSVPGNQGSANFSSSVDMHFGSSPHNSAWKYVGSKMTCRRRPLSSHHKYRSLTPSCLSRHRSKDQSLCMASTRPPPPLEHQIPCGLKQIVHLNFSCLGHRLLSRQCKSC